MRPIGVVRWVVAGALAIALQLGATSARPADENYTRLIRYSGDKLTIHVTGVPIDDILGEIQQQAGAEIRGGVRNPHPITAEFEDVPLADALHRLLGDQNFALIYGRGGGLKTLRLLGGPQNAPPAAVAVAPTAPPQAGAVSPAVLADMFARHAPIPIKGRLAQALGTDNASFTQVADAALHNEDAGVRTEAVRTAMQALEAEPELRSAVVSAVSGIGDPELGNIVRGLAGERAEEVVRHVLTTARASEIRIKASGVLQQLRTNPVAANGS